MNSPAGECPLPFNGNLRLPSFNIGKMTTYNMIHHLEEENDRLKTEIKTLAHR